MLGIGYGRRVEGHRGRGQGKLHSNAVLDAENAACCLVLSPVEEAKVQQVLIESMEVVDKKQQLRQLDDE